MTTRPATGARSDQPGGVAQAPSGPASPARPAQTQPDLAPAALRRVMVVLSVACGMAVANIYYSQPLLAPIAATFHVSQSRTALVVTLTQFGYALGMVLLLPLGDLLENRALASRTLLVSAVTLVACSLAPGYGAFLTLSVLLGGVSVVAQILIPFAAHLAPDHQRGKFVGMLMTGLLLGILLARTVSSLVAAAWGWRSIYVISAVLMVGLSFVLRRVLPVRVPSHSSSYPTLLLSTVRLAREEPALRRRALCQALMFGAFSCFWTSVAFELIRRHHLGQVGIGLFALVGAAGAAAAPVAGWLGDRGHGHLGSGAALAGAVVAMLLAGIGVGSLPLLALAGVLLDLAVQGHQVFSQREIYGLRPEARARINTVYMTSVFLGGAAATALSSVAHEHWGWGGVCVLGAALAATAFAVWGLSALRRRAAGAGTAQPTV
jgi:predicted MFS family arabinose efflux permease